VRFLSRGTPPIPRGSGATVLAVALALGSVGCTDQSDGGSKAAPTTVSTGSALSPTSAAPDTGPVTEADVAEVDQVLHRLDNELDRLDSDMATGEGDTQQVRLEAAKSVATAAITRRVLALRDLITAAKAATRLSEADRSALTNQLQEQINGLTTLNAKIQGDGDPATVRADASRIVTDYRVYVLTIPKARGVVAADIELNAAERLIKLADRLAITIDQAGAKGNDTAKAQTDLTALRTRLTAVTGTVAPLPAPLLALQPAGYPGNHSALEQGRATLRAGRAGLADAASLARQMIADLK
jgi:hypothetical protein